MPPLAIRLIGETGRDLGGAIKGFVVSNADFVDFVDDLLDGRLVGEEIVTRLNTEDRDGVRGVFASDLER
jgi:hypothetical protein